MNLVTPGMAKAFMGTFFFIWRYEAIASPRVAFTQASCCLASQSIVLAFSFLSHGGPLPCPIRHWEGR